MSDNWFQRNWYFIVVIVLLILIRIPKGTPNEDWVKKNWPFFVISILVIIIIIFMILVLNKESVVEEDAVEEVDESQEIPDGQFFPIPTINGNTNPDPNIDFHEYLKNSFKSLSGELRIKTMLIFSESESNVGQKFIGDINDLVGNTFGKSFLLNHWIYVQKGDNLNDHSLGSLIPYIDPYKLSFSSGIIEPSHETDNLWNFGKQGTSTNVFTIIPNQQNTAERLSIATNGRTITLDQTDDVWNIEIQEISLNIEDLKTPNESIEYYFVFSQFGPDSFNKILGFSGDTSTSINSLTFQFDDNFKLIPFKFIIQEASPNKLKIDKITTTLEDTVYNLGIKTLTSTQGLETSYEVILTQQQEDSDTVTITWMLEKEGNFSFYLSDQQEKLTISVLETKPSITPFTEAQGNRGKNSFSLMPVNANVTS